MNPGSKYLLFSNIPTFRTCSVPCYPPVRQVSVRSPLRLSRDCHFHTRVLKTAWYVLSIDTLTLQESLQIVYGRIYIF